MDNAEMLEVIGSMKSDLAAWLNSDYEQSTSDLVEGLLVDTNKLEAFFKN